MTVTKSKPPKIAEWLLSRASKIDEPAGLAGDFEEMYKETVTDKGLLIAWLWYWGQVIISILPFIISSISRNAAMYKNYMRIAYRNIKGHKVYSAISTSGLAIGIACCILIMLYVSYELSFDHFHENSGRIYRIGVNGQIIDVEINQVHTPKILSECLESEFPEVEEAIKVSDLSGSLISLGGKTFKDNGVIASDPEFFEVFSYPFLKGDPETALSYMNSAVITKSSAEKYFGSDDPLNKILEIRNIDFNVTGVIEDVPGNSHLQFSMILTVASFPDDRKPWKSNMYATYLVLPEDYDYKIVDKKLIDVVNSYVLPANRHFKSWKYYLEPLEDIHLHSKLQWDSSPEGNIVYVYVFTSIAFFILLIACINFMILSTAKSAIRAKEIGVRKVMGSNRIMLIKQFMIESFLLCSIGMLIGIIIVEISLPAFRSLSGRNIELHYFSNYFTIPGLLIITLFVSFFSGSYPSLYLSSINVLNVVKGGFSCKSKGDFFRNGLVLFQFSISVILIVSSLILFKQLEYFQEKNLGFNQEQIISVNNARQLGGDLNTFKESVKQHPNIMKVSSSSTIPGRGYANIQITPENSGRVHFDFIWCDHHYLETLELDLLAGRFFSPEYSTDRNAIVINQEVADQLGWRDPIGKELKFGREIISVIGVIKNYHYRSLHTRIEKLGILLSDPNIHRERYISIKLKTKNLVETLNFLQETWESFSAPVPLEYTFLDDSFESLYRVEKRAGNIALIFTVLAVFISCIGLFGLAAYLAERRTKEIGVRKVLGSSVMEILTLLARDIFILVTISSIIAYPISYFIMNRWLREFAYRIEPGISSFLIPTLVTLAVAILTVGYSAIRTALSNPVDALRYE